MSGPLGLLPLGQPLMLQESTNNSMIFGAVCATAAVAEDIPKSKGNYQAGGWMENASVFHEKTPCFIFGRPIYYRPVPLRLSTTGSEHRCNGNGLHSG